MPFQRPERGFRAWGELCPTTLDGPISLVHLCFDARLPSQNRFQYALPREMGRDSKRNDMDRDYGSSHANMTVEAFLPGAALNDDFLL